MAAYAWYYETEEGKKFWTESFSMSVTLFSAKVSAALNCVVEPKDIASCNYKSMQTKERLYGKSLIHIE